ncbi:uncharacterized protein LOC126320469 [Schistocerca gregaria]|uniref:uncharacterized protein LOC126320469 n=1 Tax=Schistocerca gregaria TaxID=7010 RepID=UPI00211E15F8|nr:uncharacterized protein LOC126320469 [Schistocerca gregaria]
MRQRQGKGYLYLESEENALVLFAWAHPEIGPPNSTLLWKFAVLLDLWWTYFEFENGGKVQWSQRSGAALTAHWNNHHFDVDLTALPLSHQKWYNAIANDPDVISLRNLASSSNKFELLRPIVQLHEDQLYGRVSATYYSNRAAQEQWLSQMENLEDYQVLRKAFLAIQSKVKMQGLESPLAARAQREMAKIQEMKLQMAMGSMLHMSSFQSSNSCYQSGGTTKTGVNGSQNNSDSGGDQDMMDTQQEEEDQELRSSSTDDMQFPQMSKLGTAEGTVEESEAKQVDGGAMPISESDEKASGKIFSNGLAVIGGKSGGERNFGDLDESENIAKSGSEGTSSRVKSNEGLQASESTTSSENMVSEKAKENDESGSGTSANHQDKENSQMGEYGGGGSKRASKGSENEATSHEGRKESNLSGTMNGSGRDRHRPPSSSVLTSSVRHIMNKTLNPRGQGGVSTVHGDSLLPAKQAAGWKQQEAPQLRGSGYGSTKQSEILFRQHTTDELVNHKLNTETREVEKIIKQMKGGGLMSSSRSQKNKKKKPISSVLGAVQESGEYPVKGEELEANAVKPSNSNQLNSLSNFDSGQPVTNYASHSADTKNSVPSNQNAMYASSSLARQAQAGNGQSVPNSTENGVKGPETLAPSSINGAQLLAGQRQRHLSDASSKNDFSCSDGHYPMPPSAAFRPEFYGKQLSPGCGSIPLPTKEGNFYPKQIYINSNSNMFDPSVQNFNFYPPSILHGAAFPSLPLFFQNHPNSSQQYLQTLHPSAQPSAPPSSDHAKTTKPNGKKRSIQASVYPSSSSVYTCPPTKRNNDSTYPDKNPPPQNNQQRPTSPNNSKKQSSNPKFFQPAPGPSDNAHPPDPNHLPVPPLNDPSPQHIPVHPSFSFFPAWSPNPAYLQDPFQNHPNSSQDSCTPGYFSMSRIVPRINDEEVKRLLNNRQFVNIARITGEFFDSLPLDRQRLHLLYCMLQIPSDSEFASFCSMYDRVTRLINS